VIGLDHYHIMSMTAAVQRGGGELVCFYATDPKQIADFRKQFGDVRLARGEDEILQDKSSSWSPPRRSPTSARRWACGSWRGQGLSGRQARHHHPGTTGPGAQSGEGHRPQVRDHVLRAAGGARRGQGRRAGQAGRSAR
jgi:hypothetical protein